MFYLLLTILTSAMIAIFMRLSNRHVHNPMVMFLANYTVCTLLSLLFQLRGGIPEDLSGLPFTLGMGTVSGFLFLASFVLLQVNIRRNGVVLSSVFMKLGVLIPTLLAVIVYHEQPGLLSVLGFLTALAAIILMNLCDRQDSTEEAGSRYLLLILLLSGGITDSLSNVFDKNGVAAFRDLYLISTFAVAGICAAALAVVKKERITVKDLLWGAVIGVPNYFTSRFLLMTLSAGVPATIVYPAANVGTILLVCIVGVIVFREQLTKQKCIGIALILAALVLLNL